MESSSARCCNLEERKEKRRTRNTQQCPKIMEKESDLSVTRHSTYDRREKEEGRNGRKDQKPHHGIVAYSNRRSIARMSAMMVSQRYAQIMDSSVIVDEAGDFLKLYSLTSMARGQ